MKRLPKGKVTVSQLLNQADVADVIRHVSELEGVENIMVIWSGKDTIPLSIWHGKNSSLLWNLKQAERELLEGDDA